MKDAECCCWMLRSGFQNILEAERAFFVTTRRQHHSNITT
jgi:hypothetical protein